MKYITLTTFILGLLLFGSSQANSKTTSATADDKEEIQNLIRQVLKWSDSKKTINLLPVLTDNNDSIYIGFDLDKNKANIEKLRETNFFTTEFIENYNQIILTLDIKLRSGEFEQWMVGDLPTFIFSNDVNPWCSCQDNLNWDQVEVKIISINKDKSELFWYWGHLSSDTDTSWKEFRYKFKVVKENNNWKIAYLQGFDFKESTSKVGI